MPAQKPWLSEYSWFDKLMAAFLLALIIVVSGAAGIIWLAGQSYQQY